MMKEIKTKSSIDSVVNMPGSKSLTHRSLIVASMAEGESVLEAFLACEDTLITAKVLNELGAKISIQGNNAYIQGTGGAFAHGDERKELHLGNSGTSYRLLLSIAALGRGEYLFQGTPRMNSRPVGDLVNALNSLGVMALCTENKGYPPVLIKARGIRGGRVDIPGNISSQYLSSLLLSGPYAEKDVEIGVTGDLISRPYVDLTIDVMRNFGVKVIHDDYRLFKVTAGQRYSPRPYRIDGDVSSASYFWAAAAVTGGRVTTSNIQALNTRQGDIVLLDVLEKMGCRVDWGPDEVTVHGGRLSGIDIDMGAMPDMVLTLAAIALFAEGKTTIRNVAHLRHKESDRLGDTAMEWEKLGGKVDVFEDGLIIHGGNRLNGALLDTHNDHRLAMSLAIAGLMVPGIMINNEECVDKSFPNFWGLWDSL